MRRHFKYLVMSLNSSRVLQVLYVIAWIIFVGLGIQAGALVTSLVFAFVKPENISKVWKEVDLTALYHYHEGGFVQLLSLIIIVAVLKALMFYVIIKLIHSRQVDFSKPFSFAMERFLLNLGYLSLGIGLFSFWGLRVAAGFAKLGVVMPDSSELKIGGPDVWLFMGVIMFVLAFIFKKGIDLQSENDLTV